MVGGFALLQQMSGLVYLLVLKRLLDTQLTDIGILCVLLQKGVQLLLGPGQLFHQVKAAHQQMFHLIFTGVIFLA